MNSELPLVTVIIPTRPGQAQVAAVTACQDLEYPAEKMEIIVARGKQPSVQRNEALKAARGDLIYFLDDDARPDRANLRRAVPHFAREDVVMMGGPNLCPAEAPFLEQVFAVVLSSWLAFGPSRARYEAVGAIRETSEKELILCNLLARRKAMLAAGGFDESLYPNEENALMDELARRGGKLLYDPGLVVFRRPRSSLGAFCRMLWTYGRGRAEQFRLHPTLGSALNFVPPLFCVYLLFGLWWGWPARLPLGGYALALLGQGGCAVGRWGAVRTAAALPMIVLTHLCYGLGFWRGLCTRLKVGLTRPRVEVALETIRSF